MKQKKIPLRSCVVTREKLPKQELIRIVRTPEGDIQIDLSGKMNGRGAYLKRSVEVVQQAKKRKALERHLEVPISDAFYDALIKEIEE